MEVRRRAIHATRLIVDWYYGQLRRVLEHEAEILAQFDTEIQTHAERLAQVLYDSDDVMRYEAAVCLADILGDVSAFQIVVDSLATPDSVIRRAVAEDIEDLCMRRRGCFGSVANKLGPFVSDADAKVRSRITHALTYCGAKAVSVLEEALGHEDECIRIGAAEALGWLDSEAQAAVPRLLGLLSDPSGKVRQAGAHAMGMVGGAAEIPRLLQLSESDTASDRDAGLHALGLLCSIRPIPDEQRQEAIARANAALEDTDKGVRSSAYFVLERIGLPGPEAEATAEKGTHDPDEGIRDSCQRWLDGLARNAKSTPS